MVPSLSYFARTLDDQKGGEDQEVLHAPATKAVEEMLGRPVQPTTDSAVWGKLTGMALHVSIFDVSAVDLTVESKK